MLIMDNHNNVPLRQDHEDALPRDTTFAWEIMLLPHYWFGRTAKMLCPGAEIGHGK